MFYCVIVILQGSIPPHLIGPAPWMNPSQYIYCTCCPPMGGGMAPLSPVLNSGNPYIQVTSLLWKVTTIVVFVILSFGYFFFLFFFFHTCSYRQGVNEGLTICSCCTGCIISIDASPSLCPQGYSYSSLPGVVIPQIPMNYSQAAYATAYACQVHAHTQTLIIHVGMLNSCAD